MDALNAFFVRQAEEFLMDSIRAQRALHWRYSPWPVLRGPRLSRWIARKLRVRADIHWTQDPDWEPPKIVWNEDEELGA